MNQRALDALFQLNQEAWTEISRDPSLPQSIKTMVYLHITKRWIPSFLSVAIAPLKPGLDRFLSRAVFEYDGLTYYFPSREWWTTHATVSHPPDGSGCDVWAHKAFLTPQGQFGEFSYVSVLRDGSVEVLDQSDFELECAFFEAGRDQAI